MLLQIWQAGEATELDLADGTVDVGGSDTDAVRVEGLAPALLRLQVSGERLVAVARETVTIGEVLFPPHVGRLILPGESIGLPGEVRLCRPAPAENPRRELATAMVAKKLLWELEEPEQTRAATLTCVTGLDAGRRFPIDFSAGVIGRGREAQLRIRDRAVSRRHARLVREGARCLISSLGGPNGVFVNGEQVHGQRELRTGDVLELGHSVLRFDGPEEEPAPAPSEEKPAEPAAPPLEPAGRKPPRRTDWVLVAFGALLAVVGILTTYALT